MNYSCAAGPHHADLLETPHKNIGLSISLNSFLQEKNTLRGRASVRRESAT
jgi:hypothetical protein